MSETHPVEPLATRESGSAPGGLRPPRLHTLEAFLDEVGIGEGPVDLSPLGEGHSNLTFLLVRGGERLVLRRPPHGPLAPSTHDVLREARLLQALRPRGMRVPEVLCACEDETVIGAPFYLMRFMEGHVLSAGLPAELSHERAPARIATELVESLVEIHAADVSESALAGFGRPSGYLERQIARFSRLLERNATRPLAELEQVASWLAANLPSSTETTLVHGDYRLGNVMFAPDRPRLTAVLDWEMATLGDPLADLGYMTATWAEAGDADNPMLDLSRVTRLPGFPDRAGLADAYAAASGRALDALPWYQALALWKAAIFLEGSYRRYLAGSTSDPHFASLESGVKVLARLALSRAHDA